MVSPTSCLAYLGKGTETTSRAPRYSPDLAGDPAVTWWHTGQKISFQWKPSHGTQCPVFSFDIHGLSLENRAMNQDLATQSSLFGQSPYCSPKMKNGECSLTEETTYVQLSSNPGATSS
uniref:Uncharacterized protein n=1 Tax=Bionectria ochroleuca TaxID=29856 RepID=A0A8H7N801_BIOOC